MMLDVGCLDETCLQKLANEEVLAIRLKHFLPGPLALQIGNKILARVKLMDFGPKDVGDFTMDYPIVFFPQN